VWGVGLAPTAPLAAVRAVLAALYRAGSLTGPAEPLPHEPAPYEPVAHEPVGSAAEGSR